MELTEDMAEPKKGPVMQSTSRRVRMIFSVMASPNRIDILRILNSKGPLTYSELKSLAGFRSKKESGKFAYHLRKLLRQSLVALNKSERRYTITNLGKLVLSLARQIEERSIIESGKMYVRTSHETIEEFNSHRIVQSLIREGSLPSELAQKITEEVENRIYKYQTTYLTGSLIREMVNSVLLEHGHEEYRNKLARLGLPPHDIQAMLSSVEDMDSGAEGLLSRTGREVFAEHLLTNILPKDVADSHLAGDLHIANPGTWSLLPDTLFVNLREVMEEGLDLGGKLFGASRIPSIKTPDGLSAALSMVIMLVSREASREVVLDGLAPLLSKYAKGAAGLEERLAGALSAASVVPRHGSDPVTVSFRLQLGTDPKMVGAVIHAYKEYARITPVPRIGLVIDHEKGRLSDVTAELAEIISAGGRIVISRGGGSYGGSPPGGTRGQSLSVHLESVSVNLPRLALESNKDETYFRARLALLMKPALAAMAMRKKEVSDLTRRGLNPLLAQNSQYMQRGSVTLTVNLVGLREAVFSVLGYENDRAGREVLHKVVETAVDVAKKKGKELGDDVRISMTEGGGASRFAILDGEKYGKNSALKSVDTYSEGVVLDAAGQYTAKSEGITECNRLSKMLNGGLLVLLPLDKGADDGAIREALERTAGLVARFRPVKPVSICGGCGYKDNRLEGRCPRCKSPHIL